MKKIKIVTLGLAGTLLLSGNLLVCSARTMEGAGFDSPEAAVEVYLEGFQNNDIDQMMSAFALETYVENFDMEKYVDRYKAYMPELGFIPGISDYAKRLNLEQRRTDVSETIRQQYLTITESSAAVGEDAGAPRSFRDSEMTAKEFLAGIFADSDEAELSSVKFDGSFIYPELLSEKYEEALNQENMQKYADCLGADEMKSVTAVFTIERLPYLLCADAVRYGDKWYLFDCGGNIGALLGISWYNKGLVLMDDEPVDDVAAELAEALEELEQLRK